MTQIQTTITITLNVPRDRSGDVSEDGDEMIEIIPTEHWGHAERLLIVREKWHNCKIGKSIEILIDKAA